MKLNDVPFEKLADAVDLRKIKKEGLAEYTKSPLYRKAHNAIVDKKYRDFLPHCMAYLAQVPVVSNKPSECLQKLQTLEYVEVYGEKFPAKQLIAMIKYLTFVNRGSLLVGKMTEGLNRRYGSLTPLLMFALKENRNIPYDYWDKKDPAIEFFLSSKTLFTSLITDKDKIPTKTIEEILRARNFYIGKAGANAYRVVGFNSEARINGVHDFVRSMIYQTWLASEDNRDTDSMILDPLNWSNIPPLLIESSANPNKVTDTSLDLSWLDF